MESKIKLTKNEQVLYGSGFNYVNIVVTVVICALILFLCLYYSVENLKSDDVSLYSLVGVAISLGGGCFLVRYIKSLKKITDDELVVTNINIKWVVNGKADCKSWQQIEACDIDFTSDNKTFLLIKSFDKDVIRLDLTYIDFNLRNFCIAANEAFANIKNNELKCNPDVDKEKIALLDYEALRRKRASSFTYDYLP